MAFRSTESPMDFEWNAGHGPIDQKSPFLQRPFSDKSQTWSGSTAQKRSFQDYDSPRKSTAPAFSNQAPFTSGSNPSMLQPTTPSAKIALPQFRQSSFTTPQRAFDLDFSSGMDNESSPGADNEDTPEQPVRQIIQFSGNPTHQKRNSPAKSHFTAHHAPGRGEIVRRPHHDALRRVNKKRRRDVDRDVRSSGKRQNDDSDSSDQPAYQGSDSQRPTQHSLRAQTRGFIPSTLSFINDHPHLPVTLSYYAQFMLNIFVVSIIIYGVSSIYLSIREDFQKAASLASSEVMAEMAACASEYRENNCKDITARVPAMRSVCESWERCMSRDPQMVGRAKVSAKTFAEILSSFVDGVSVKALGLGGALFIGCWALGNLSFSWFRAKVEPTVGYHGSRPNALVGEQGFARYDEQIHEYRNGDGNLQRLDGYQGRASEYRNHASPSKQLEWGSPVKKLEYR